MDSIWHRLNPRYRLSAMIGWVVFIVVSMAAVVGAVVSAETAERQARENQEQRLQQFAAQIMRRDDAQAAADVSRHWRALVRQDEESLLAAAQRTRNAVFTSTLLSGILAALVAAMSARLLLGRLRRLAAQAQALQAGAIDRPDPVRGNDEVAYIASTLAVTLLQLQEEKQRLYRLNSELDARVAERTARIERMSEEARQAAVVRERLRMARELHDTLAHSLMALLTQLRMIRKLHGHWSPQELDAELRDAESAAQTGLADARASIQQMRHNDVRELGLGLAIQALLQRWSEHTEVHASLQIDEGTEDTAGERAETVFRIVEEALRNIEKHAHADHVRLLVGKAQPAGGDMSGLRIEIEDDGVGFDVSIAKEGHFGLQGIQEQAELIGAQLRMTSREGMGTKLVLVFEP